MDRLDAVAGHSLINLIILYVDAFVFVDSTSCPPGEIVEVHDTQDALDPTLVLDSQPDPLDSFWNSTEAPESLSTLKSTESTLTLPYSPGTMDGIAVRSLTALIYQAQKYIGFLSESN